MTLAATGAPALALLAMGYLQGYCWLMLQKHLCGLRLPCAFPGVQNAAWSSRNRQDALCKRQVFSFLGFSMNSATVKPPKDWLLRLGVSEGREPSKLP